MPSPKSETRYGKSLCHLSFDKAKSICLLLFLFIVNTSFSQDLLQEDEKIILLKSALDTVNGTSKADLLNDICDEFERISLDSSIVYARKALELSEMIAYTKGIVNGLNNIGYYHQEKSMYDSALWNFNKALHLAEKTNNLRLQSHCWNFLGRVHRSLFNMPKAIDCFIKSMEIRHEIGDTTGIAMVSGNLGYLYWSLKDYENAEKYMTKSLELDLQLGDSLYIGNDYLNLGLLYQKQGDLEKGIAYSEKSMEILKSQNDQIGVAILYGNISLMFSEQGRFDKAKEYLDKSLEMKLELGDNPFSLSYTYGNYQKIYQDNDNYPEAIKAGLRAMDYLSKYPNTQVKQRVLERLAKAYAKIGDHERGYNYLQQFNAVKDSILDEEKSRQIQQLQTIYETNRKDVTIAQQEGELKLAQASNRFKTSLTWILAIGLVVIFAGIYFFRSYRFALKSKEMEEAFAQQLLLAHEDERKRISQDLHDSVGQSLILIKNKVSLSKDDDTSEMVSKALEEVRSISKALHPATLDKIGLTASIEKQIREIDQNSDIFFSEEIESIDRIFSKEQELQIYRIFQEAINNLIKHSQSKSALIKIENETKHVRLSVIDYGVGFDLTSDTSSLQGLGMKTLRERTQLLGGKILIDSTKNKGTSVILQVTKPDQHV